MCSQGASREGSPQRTQDRTRKSSAGAATRLTQGSLRLHQKATGGVMAQRVLVPTTDAERALADALVSDMSQ